MEKRKSYLTKFVVVYAVVVMAINLISNILPENAELNMYFSGGIFWSVFWIAVVVLLLVYNFVPYIRQGLFKATLIVVGVALWAGAIYAMVVPGTLYAHPIDLFMAIEGGILALLSCLELEYEPKYQPEKKLQLKHHSKHVSV